VAKANFDAIWIPRMGPEATAQLKRVGVAVLWNFLDIPLVVVVSIGVGSGRPVGVVLGLIAAVIVIVLFGLLNREHRKLASDLSQWFQVKVNWWEMPRFSEVKFDAWCERRRLQHQA
jgi:hypothetical protein